jgi:hypothetical protein
VILRECELKNLRLSEPAPHHSTEKHGIAVHIRLPLSTACRVSNISPASLEFIQNVRMQSCCQLQVLKTDCRTPFRVDGSDDKGTRAIVVPSRRLI